MSYRDPYAEQYGASQPRRQQTAYTDSAPEFNPYTTSQQPHATYEQGGSGYDNYGAGYTDAPRSTVGGAQPGPQRQATMRSFLTGNDERTNPSYAAKNVPPLPLKDTDGTSASGFDHGEFSATPRGEKSFRNFKHYRHEFKDTLWTKGSRGRCIGRFFCCTIMITLLLVISILLALVLWVRPPAISIGEIATPTTNATLVQTDGIIINRYIDIQVNNPNYFGVKLKKISAEIFYPINDTLIGGGTSYNVDFASHTNTTFTFPFALDYQFALDPRFLILTDLATKCGALTGTQSDITINYKITLGITILGITVSPVVSNPTTFACPLDQAAIAKLISDAGLSGLLGSS